MESVLPDPEVLQVALKLVAKRAWLVAELRSTLLAKGFLEADVEPVIAHLTRRGFVQDSDRLAAIRARAGDDKRGLGRLRVEQELLRIGATEAQVRETLAEIGDDEELGKIEALLRKRYPAGLDRAKAGRFLLSRGFEEELIELALDRHRGDDESLSS